MRTRRTYKSIFSEQRGSLFIEMLVVFPVFVSLWLLGMYVAGFNVVELENQERIRSCAWFYATSGCEQLPPQCDVQQQGPTVMSDGALRAAAAGKFDTIAQRIPILAPELASLHGQTFEMRRKARVPRPALFGGSVEVGGQHAMMCNARKADWTFPILFRPICEALMPSRWYGGSWCP